MEALRKMGTILCMVDVGLSSDDGEAIRVLPGVYNDKFMFVPVQESAITLIGEDKTLPDGWSIRGALNTGGDMDKTVRLLNLIDEYNDPPVYAFGPKH